MADFIHDDFLLHSEFARRLYHAHASRCPIIDYHCHLPPSDIASNTNFENITAIWLAGDHYKWRAMRAAGINEKFITGSASPLEKFRKWADTVPFTIRNPLYHWVHMELKRYFGVTQLLDSKSASDIYEQCTQFLKLPEYSTKGLIEKMNVEVICTTDDPADKLEEHNKIRGQHFKTNVLPAFRPDKGYAISEPGLFNAYIQMLGAVSDSSIDSYSDLIETLIKRIDYFHESGCRLADHGLDHFQHDTSSTLSPEVIFQNVRKGRTPSKEEAQYFKYAVLIELCRSYHAHGWVQQFHLGALRNTNDRMFASLGADTGFDSIGDFEQASGLARFLNTLDRTNQLTKTILYNLNPAVNEVMATMTGNFNDGSVKGKMQFGSAWWFLDQKNGIEMQLNTLSNLGLLSCFIGMITDSRSFLSFPRHEYFRRILCNLIGQEVEKGELPRDEIWLGKIVADVCYNNARDYFQF